MLLRVHEPRDEAAVAPLTQDVLSAPEKRTRAWRRAAWCGGVLLLLLALGTAAQFLGGGAGPNPRKEYAQHLHQSFRGGAESILPGEGGFGPDAEQCMRRGPDGLSLNLPAGHPGVRPNTGLATELVVKGDFEIVVDFEIVREPTPAMAGKFETRFTLDLALDRPGLNAASLSRTVDGRGIQFVTWSALQPEVPGEIQRSRHFFPAEGKAGRLRVVRSGAELFYFGSGGSAQEPTYLWKDTIGKDDLRTIRLVGSTGGPGVDLEVRVHDLRVSADALPQVQGASPKGRRWLSVAGFLVLGSGLAALGVWLAARRSRRPR